MKIETTFNKAIVLFPCITQHEFTFLFWILSFKPNTEIKWIWITPFICYSYNEGKHIFWMCFGKWGFENFKFMRYKHTPK